MGPPDSAESDSPTILKCFLDSILLPAPSDFPKMIQQTVLNFPPLTPPYSTKMGALTVTSTRPSTPSNSAKSDLQANAPFHSTPYKINQKSGSSANLSTRRAVFCANIGELTRVEMGCKMKIDSLFSKAGRSSRCMVGPESGDTVIAHVRGMEGMGWRDEQSIQPALSITIAGIILQITLRSPINTH